MFMIEQLIPEDIAQDDTDHHKSIRRLAENPMETTDDTEHHKSIRRLAETPMETTDDTEFTLDEVRQTIEEFKLKKEPWPYGMNE
jgi:hypothetical protein